MTTLSDRARELGEWLRSWEKTYSASLTVANTFSRAEILSREHDLFKSRAEAVESLLAENERLRSALKECGDALGSCQHRVMTAGEYLAWSRGGGDAVSFSGTSGAMSGGVTILWNTPAMIGKILP